MKRTLPAALSLALSVLPLACLLSSCAGKTELAAKRSDGPVLTATVTNLCRENPYAQVVVDPASLPLDSLDASADPAERFAFIPNHQAMLRSFRKRNSVSIQHAFAGMPDRKTLAAGTGRDTVSMKVPEVGTPSVNVSAEKTHVRLSAPAYNRAGDSAVVYVEARGAGSTDFGKLYLLARSDPRWKVVDAAAVWTFTKPSRREMYFGCTVKNIEEDTITYRLAEDVEAATAGAAKRIEEMYRSLYTEPRPEGTVWVEAVVNCAGDVLKLRAHSQEISDSNFLDEIMRLLASLKYVDNLRTSRCGAVEVTYSFTFRG
jgi:hypothetical protein